MRLLYNQRLRHRHRWQRRLFLLRFFDEIVDHRHCINVWRLGMCVVLMCPRRKQRDGGDETQRLRTLRCW